MEGLLQGADKSSERRGYLQPLRDSKDSSSSSIQHSKSLLADLELDSIYSQAEKMVSQLSAASPQGLDTQ
jgi:hypothetical protein